MDNREARALLAAHITNPAHSPVSCLGAVTALLRTQGGEAERRIAEAVDRAVKEEISAMEADTKRAATVKG